MRLLIVMILILFSVSCRSDPLKGEEKGLFDKLIAFKQGEKSEKLSDDDYEQVLIFISQGKEPWVRLYPQLKKEPFSGVAFFQEGIDIAMAEALAENPAIVLEFVNKYNVGFICGMPFIEPSDNEIRDYYAKTTAAIRQLPAQGDGLKICSTVLNKTIAGWKWGRQW